MTLDYLKQYVKEKSLKYPEHADDIYYLLYLAEGEIEVGESESNEVELAINSINKLFDGTTDNL